MKADTLRLVVIVFRLIGFHTSLEVREMHSRSVIRVASMLVLCVWLSACGVQTAPPLPSPTATPSQPAYSPITPEELLPTTAESAPAPSPVAAETPAWYSLLPLTPEPAPTPSQVWPSLLPPTPQPQQILGGGSVESGPFTFILWVIKDPDFGHNPVAPSLYSDLEGRAVYMGWMYRGETTFAGPVFEYWGLPLPRPDALPAEYARVEPGWGGGRVAGVHFRPDLLPAEKPPEGPVRVGFLLITPQGPYGACIRFALTGDGRDIDPASIGLGHLPCEEFPLPASR